MKKVKKYILVVCGFMIVGTGAAFSLKANVGVGAWDALAKSISDVVSIEVGTIGIALNCSCVLGQIIVLKKDFKLIQLLQIPLSILLGTVINLVFYNLPFEVTSFSVGLVMFVCAITVCAFGVSMVMVLDEVTFALEAFSMALTKVLPFKFSTIRQLFDVLSVIGVVILTLVFKIELSIGVGTIIGVFIFGPMLGIFMKLLKPVFKKANLLDYE